MARAERRVDRVKGQRRLAEIETIGEIIGAGIGIPKRGKTEILLHARKGQFVTQNFDLDWRGYSYGIQPAVDHFAAARALDVAGIDIYHPTQDHLTGAEIAFGGDLARSMRRGQNYLVIETEAQGFPEWTPYPGQLRLQAFSHLASGAQMVEYWHWGTTANAVETYWRGLLSQDFKPNPTYDEAGSIGKDLARLGPQLANMRKSNRIAIYVSNRALTAFNSFKFGWTSTTTYNDVLRPFYDALYRMNAEVDFVDPSTTDLSDYKLILVPALYAASDAEIERLNAFAKAGGHLLYTFKSGFSDENVRVRSTTQPGLIAEAAGVHYNQFTIPAGVTLENDPYHVGAADNIAHWWMELLTPTTATIVARYHHPVWGKYAAIVRNNYGKGEVTYVGFMVRKQRSAGKFQIGGNASVALKIPLQTQRIETDAVSSVCRLEDKKYWNSIDRVFKTATQKSREMQVGEDPSVAQSGVENSCVATSAADGMPAASPDLDFAAALVRGGLAGAELR